MLPKLHHKPPTEPMNTSRQVHKGSKEQVPLSNMPRRPSGQGSVYYPVKRTPPEQNSLAIRSLRSKYSVLSLTLKYSE